MDVFYYIAGSLGMKKMSSKLPVIDKCDVSGNLDNHVRSILNESPKLYLFFDRNGHFEYAECAGDNSAIHLQAGDISQAIFLFLSVFHVFHIGFPKNQEQFLSFLQEVFLDEKYEGTKAKGWKNLMGRIKLEREEMEELTKYRKPGKLPKLE